MNSTPASSRHSIKLSISSGFTPGRIISKSSSRITNPSSGLVNSSQNRSMDSTLNSSTKVAISSGDRKSSKHAIHGSCTGCSGSSSSSATTMLLLLFIHTILESVSESDCPSLPHLYLHRLRHHHFQQS